MRPYINLRSPSRLITRIVFPFGLGFFCLIYGFFYALTTPYLIVPVTIPIVALVLMSIWALPDRPHAPTKTMEFFFAALLIILILWPNYLALALPGLPWITGLRLAGFPMAFFFLICLSTSKEFRAELGEAMRSVPYLWVVLTVFVVMQFITIPFGKSPPAGAQRALLQQVNWTSMFLIGAWVGRTPGRAQRYIILAMLLAIPISAIDILEAHEQKVLWVGHVPSFLKVDDPSAALILSSAIRGATGLYRVKATFSTPLGLAEYLALLTPFALHMFFGQNRFLTKAVGLLLLPFLFYCIRMTDARLGIVGLLVSILAYVLFWGLLRLFRNRTDLFAAAVVYAYPALFCTAAAAVLFVHRLNVMVFGGGAQEASNEARKNQLHMAIPKIIANPIGHGPGGSGAAMGYAAGDFITIDNYYLNLALDYGVIGITAFLAMFLMVITAGVRATVRSAQIREKEITLLVPLTVVMSAFLVIKLVFSQPDNHPLVFAMLGLLVGLIYRVQAANAQITTAAPVKPGAKASRRVKPRILVAARAPLPEPNRGAAWR